jgi:hypothetical protein
MQCFVGSNRGRLSGKRRGVRLAAGPSLFSEGSRNVPRRCRFRFPAPRRPREGEPAQLLFWCHFEVLKDFAGKDERGRHKPKR